MQILVLTGTVGSSPHNKRILPLCDFFDCPVLSFFLGNAPRWNRKTDFYALWLKRRTEVPLGDRTMADVIWGKYAP